jgi:hypothetical protein
VATDFDLDFDPDFDFEESTSIGNAQHARRQRRSP